MTILNRVNSWIRGVAGRLFALALYGLVLYTSVQSYGWLRGSALTAIVVLLSWRRVL